MATRRKSGESEIKEMDKEREKERVFVCVCWLVDKCPRVGDSHGLEGGRRVKCELGANHFPTDWTLHATGNKKERRKRGKKKEREEEEERPEITFQI